ncbi:ATP-binding protein [Streptomyces sp. NPDC096033]|uniref:ATP-binding protein n=1 Tax=Streptomyces sp. NPDC096033 TaxID=3366071 RepID=UPI00382BA4D6
MPTPGATSTRHQHRIRCPPGPLRAARQGPTQTVTATCRRVVILFGRVEVGKTHVAQALGHLAIRLGAHVRFAKTSRVMAELAGGYADRTWGKRMRELVCPDVLILDDFAMRQLTAAQADDLYKLVSEQQGRSLIVTSNRAPSNWYPLFPNPVVAGVAPGPTDQHQPSGHHERPQLPSERATQGLCRQAREVLGQLGRLAGADVSSG